MDRGPMDRVTPKRLRRLAWAAGLFALYQLYQADFWKAERFKEQTRQALEQSLGRRVVINGEARYSWRTAPGITVEDVVIHEDPRHGREPMMYVTAIHTRVRLLSLLSGRLALDLVRLDEPSVNLSRDPAGFNATPFLERILTRRASQQEPLPDVRIVNGRINFVADRRKSVLYLSNADLDLTPIDERTFRVQFEGAPARTDRKALGFGRFRTTGLLRLGLGKEQSTADLTFELDNSNVAEVAALIDPRAANLAGRISSRAKLKGTFSDATLTGSVTFGTGRRDLNPLRASAIPLHYSGRVNLREQTLSLDATRELNPDLGAVARFRARDILQRPRWAALATFHDVPSAPVFTLARNLALIDVEPSLLKGKFAGAISIVDGLPQGGALLDTNEDKQEWHAGVVVQGDHVDLALDLRDTPVKALKPFLSKTFADSVPSLITHLEDGLLTGNLRAGRQGDEQATWSGKLRLTNASLRFPQLAEPLLASALADLDGPRLSITALSGRFAAAQLNFQGTYQYDPVAARPHRFAFSSSAASAAALEKLLAPALLPPSGQVPTKMSADGSLRFNQLDVAGLTLRPARAQVRWEGSQVLFTSLEAGPSRGTLRITLGGPQPLYRYDGACAAVPWKGGTMDARIQLETSGIGPNLWANLQSTTSWVAKGFRLTPEQEVKQATGTLTGRTPLLRLANVQLLLGSESYTGEGTVETGGKWNALLTSGTRQLRLSGEMLPVTLELKP
jgi:AsmA family